MNTMKPLYLRGMGLLLTSSIIALGATFSVPSSALASGGSKLQFSGIDRLTVAGGIDVRLQQGSEESVVIESSGEAAERTTVSQSGSTLRIQHEGSWRFWSTTKVRAIVTVKDLKTVALAGSTDLQTQGPIRFDQFSLAIAGSGAARFDDFSGENLSIRIAGSGEATFVGKARDLKVAIAGKGNVGGENLQTQRSVIAISGVGHVAVWVLEELRVSVSGAGTVDYWGVPKTVQQQVAGSAAINDKGQKR